MSKNHKLKEELILNLTDEDFERFAIAKGVRAVVEFSSSESGAGQIMVPIIDDLAKEFAGRISFFRLDCSICTESAARFGVRIRPSYLLFMDGTVMSRIQGIATKSELRECLVDLLSK